MTIENFLVHQETRRGPQTDVDILATRFAFRRENLSMPMIDDPQVTECPTFANIIIAEIKTGLCDLNGPWSDPGRQQMERVLLSIGCAMECEIDSAAQSLYTTGRWSNGISTVRLFAVGDRTNNKLVIGDEQQLKWTSMIEFCVNRFKTYSRQKASNGQWERDGRELMRLAVRDKNGSSFGAIRSYFGLCTSERTA